MQQASSSSSSSKGSLWGWTQVLAWQLRCRSYSSPSHSLTRSHSWQLQVPPQQQQQQQQQLVRSSRRWRCLI
jgi:hypothetical protein